MKNKKLVATVASLCLVVVAVVAAVVGVFAAVTQNVTNTFTVKYTAKNVHATVSLDSMGPVYAAIEDDYANRGTRTLDQTWTADSGTGAHVTETFLPKDVTGQASGTAVTALTGREHNLGWNSESNSTIFYGEAAYRFKFQNLSSTGASLNVRVSFDTGASLASTTYLKISFFKATVSETSNSIVLSSFTVARDNDTKAVTGITESSDDVDSFTLTNGVADLTVANNSSAYLYMVIAVDLEHSNADSPLTALGSLLSFELTNTVSAA